MSNCNAAETETDVAVARRVAAYRRAAMEVAREATGDIPLGAAATIFYAVEAEGRITSRPPDEVAAGDPVAMEGLLEVAREGLHTHRMRGFLARNWELVSERAANILRVEAVGEDQ